MAEKSANKKTVEINLYPWECEEIIYLIEKSQDKELKELIPYIQSKLFSFRENL